METPAALDPKAAVERTLDILSHEVRADVLLVLHNGALVAQRSSFPINRIDAFVELLRRWSEVANQMAAFLGEAYGRFRQFHFEGERYHVYEFDVNDNVALIVVCRTDVSFGTIRLAIKTASADIAKYLR